MKFESARCETCRAYIFTAAFATAFRLEDGWLEPVELEGQGPWSGVRVMCPECLKFFRSCPVPEVTSPLAPHI
jgi:hypothetical protein